MRIIEFLHNRPILKCPWFPTEWDLTVGKDAIALQAIARFGNVSVILLRLNVCVANSHTIQRYL